MTTSPESGYTIAIAEGVATITIDRPPLNVFDIAMMKALNNNLIALREREDLIALVWKGAGRCFSAGVDVEIKS